MSADQASRTGSVVDAPLLSEFHVEDFRCLERVELGFDGALNVFTGLNGAGKTSLLEAIFMLGRGRSFRASDSRVLVRRGTAESRLRGLAHSCVGSTPIGMRLSAAGTEIRIGGRPGGSLSELAALLPVQAIHAESSALVQGPPDGRRRLLDWGVFHVKHDYLQAWREFRRALAQRNAALRETGSEGVLGAWEDELARAAARVDRERAEYLEVLAPTFAEVGERLLGEQVAIEYQRGWPAAVGLEQVLRESREGDRDAGYTRQGPHRADLRLEIGTLPSRSMASRGQQKLLAAALMLAQCQDIARREKRRMVLLLDEPAADLDAQHLGRLVREAIRTPAQLFIGTVSLAELDLPAGSRMFHVEHGNANALL